MWDLALRLQAVIALLVLCHVVCDLVPLEPDAGSLLKDAKPVGFGLKGVDLQSPEANDTKVLPFDLADCDVDNCLLCDEFDKNECIMCDDSSLYKWLDTDGSCATACASGDVKIFSADRGYRCIGCQDADERECTQYCTSFRWDSLSSNCTEACQLPTYFGRNTARGTCVPGQELSASASCTVECINGAAASVANGLTYSCSSDGDALTEPSAVCESVWDHITVEGEDLGEVYRELAEEWTAIDCSNLTAKELSGSSFAVVDNALAALGLPNSSYFDFHCEASAAFPGNARFFLNTSSSFELVVDKVTITAPTLYFSKDRQWNVRLFAPSTFTMPDDASTVETETMGVYNTAGVQWTLRTAILATWEEPFDHAWLTNHEIIAGYTYVDGVGNETLDMWSTCTLSVGSIEDEGSFTYTYGSSSDATLVKVELADADIHSLIALVEDLEGLDIKPEALRDFYLTEPLAVVASDTDGIYIDEAWGTVDAGLTWGTTMKLVGDSRLHAGLRCLGAHSQWFYLRFFASSSSDDVFEIVHVGDVEANSAWTSSNIVMLADWSDDSFNLDVAADLHIDLNKGSYDLPFSMRYNATQEPVATTAVPYVNDTLGFVGLDVEDVNGVFRWDQKSEVCSIYLTGTLGLSNAGVLNMRGVVHDSAPSHSYWAVPSRVDGVSVGLDLVPWWNKVYPDLAIDDSNGLLSDIVVDSTSITIATSNSPGVSFPATDDGSSVNDREFSHGWVLSGLQTHLSKAKSVGVTMTYIRDEKLDPSFVVEFDSNTIDNMVDGLRSTYISDADAMFADRVFSQDDELQQNMSIGLQIEASDWDSTEFTPYVRTITLPDLDLATIGSTSSADHFITVDMVVVWADAVYDFAVPTQFADLEGDYVADFVESLAFECTNSSDCAGSQVCRHTFVGGELNSSATQHTWHCESSCSSDEFDYGDVGCFAVFSPGSQCNEPLPCGENHCIEGVCRVRYDNGHSCTVAKASFCLSEFCCEGCGNTCQDYPLDPGFNCSVGLEYNECASNWCSSEEGDVDIDAVCLALIEDGEACDEDAHCVSEYCSAEQDDICVTQYNVTGPCYEDDDCLGSLTCCWECGFECQPYPRPFGVGCVKDADCQTDFCSSTNYVCAEALEDGETCTQDEHCVSGYCSPDRDVCYTSLDDEESCSYDSDCTSEFCSTDRSDICYSPLSDGDACTYDSDCSSQWCTTSASSFQQTTASTATCQTKYSSGETCVFDIQCDSGDCSVSCTWFVCQCV